MAEHRLAAVVPAWNEAAAIADVVRGLRGAGACCVFVVDGGSTDGTQQAITTDPGWTWSNAPSWSLRWEFVITRR